ncbi:response regulator [Echinicola jeungdonensis]|nr:response regulator [Echinicola jeungdonensis]MDN3668784.1 response regulator [Echinicola jeungdonensis]
MEDLKIYCSGNLSPDLHHINQSIIEKTIEENRPIINLDPAQVLISTKIVQFPPFVSFPIINEKSLLIGNLFLADPQLSDPTKLNEIYFPQLKLICHQISVINQQKEKIRELETHLELNEKMKANLKRKVNSNKKIFKKKSRLLAHVSHEIRTPMQGIIGLTEKLRNSPLNQEQKEILDNLSISESTLMNLVNEVLDFSKINDSGFNLQFKPGYIQDIIEEVKILYTPMANDKGNTIITESPILPPLEIDVLRLKQVMSNMVNNALKFTTNGSVTIRAQKSETVDGQDWYRFEIEDTGVGISNDFKEIIYKEYSQSGNFDTNGGTGLGLAISKMIIDKFGGKYGFVSPVDPNNEDQPGSLFWFSLPLKTSTETPNQTKKEIIHQFQGKKVLFIDDDQFVQMVCKNMLEQEGLFPRVVSSGQEAMELMEKESFDLILSDLNLPGMNGLEIAQIIKSEYNYQGPLACISAYQDEDSIQKAKMAGFNHFISKPFNQRTLKKLLSKISD